jgi:hypothetical protein
MGAGWEIQQNFLLNFLGRLTQRGKSATKFWILDFGFWIEE